MMTHMKSYLPFDPCVVGCVGVCGDGTPCRIPAWACAQDSRLLYVFVTFILQARSIIIF